MVTVELRQDPSEIARATAFLEDFAAAQGIDERTLFQLNLCLEELLTNIIAYGSRGRSPASSVTIVFSMEYRDHCLRMILKDNATAFNPLAYAVEPDLDSELDERKIGGLGIHLVKTFMDTIRYTYQHDGNRLELEKRININSVTHLKLEK